MFRRYIFYKRFHLDGRKFDFFTENGAGVIFSKIFRKYCRDLENLRKKKCLSILKADLPTRGCGINMIEGALNYSRVVVSNSKTLYWLI